LARLLPAERIGVPGSRRARSSRCAAATVESRCPRCCRNRRTQTDSASSPATKNTMSSHVITNTAIATAPSTARPRPAGAGSGSAALISPRMAAMSRMRSRTTWRYPIAAVDLPKHMQVVRVSFRRITTVEPMKTLRRTTANPKPSRTVPGMASIAAMIASKAITPAAMGVLGDFAGRGSAAIQLEKAWKRFGVAPFDAAETKKTLPSSARATTEM